MSTTLRTKTSSYRDRRLRVGVLVVTPGRTLASKLNFKLKSRLNLVVSLVWFQLELLVQVE
jgi:hypothetical protein